MGDRVVTVWRGVAADCDSFACAHGGRVEGDARSAADGEGFAIHQAAVGGRATQGGGGGAIVGFACNRQAGDREWSLAHRHAGVGAGGVVICRVSRSECNWLAGCAYSGRGGWRGECVGSRDTGCAAAQGRAGEGLAVGDAARCRRDGDRRRSLIHRHAGCGAGDVVVCAIGGGEGHALAGCAHRGRGSRRGEGKGSIDAGCAAAQDRAGERLAVGNGRGGGCGRDCRRGFAHRAAGGDILGRGTAARDGDIARVAGSVAAGGEAHIDRRAGEIAAGGDRCRRAKTATRGERNFKTRRRRDGEGACESRAVHGETLLRRGGGVGRREGRERAAGAERPTRSSRCPRCGRCGRAVTGRIHGADLDIVGLAIRKASNVERAGSGYWASGSPIRAAVCGILVVRNRRPTV